MTNFEESKLSRIIARRIVVPEDRSQLLPFATPIYCPNNNGVRANKVTIFNPNANTYYTSDIEDTVFIDSKVIDRPKQAMIPVTGDVQVSDTGIATNFGVGNYLSFETDGEPVKEVHVVGYIPEGITSDVDLVSLTGNNYQVMVEVTQNGNINLTIIDGDEETYDTLGTAKFNETINLTVRINEEGDTRTIELDSTGMLEDGSRLLETIETSNTVISLVSFGTGSDARYEMNLPQSSITMSRNGGQIIDKTILFGSLGAVELQPDNSRTNTIDIYLQYPLRVKYFVPHETQLKSHVDLMEQIKSDFAIKFKKFVSAQIFSSIQEDAGEGVITTVTMGDNLAESIGKVIANNISTGTGQKYSIYKYDNGAPITYIQSSEQPNIDDKLLYKSDDVEGCGMVTFTSDYASKDDVDVPALYYCARPTLILPGTTFEEYQSGLCDGSIRTYVESRINVDTAAIDFSLLGEGIFGTNDTYAVAFTEPTIKIAPSIDYFADEICIEVYTGVRRIHDNNLRKLGQ